MNTILKAIALLFILQLSSCDSNIILVQKDSIDNTGVNQNNQVCDGLAADLNQTGTFVFNATSVDGESPLSHYEWSVNDGILACEEADYFSDLDCHIEIQGSHISNSCSKVKIQTYYKDDGESSEYELVKEEEVANELSFNEYKTILYWAGQNSKYERQTEIEHEITSHELDNGFNCTFTYSNKVDVFAYVNSSDIKGCLTVDEISLTFFNLTNLNISQYDNLRENFTFQFYQVSQDFANYGYQIVDVSQVNVTDELKVRYNHENDISVTGSNKFNLVQNYQYIQGSTAFQLNVMLEGKDHVLSEYFWLKSDYFDQQVVYTNENYELTIKGSISEDRCDLSYSSSLKFIIAAFISLFITTNL